MGANLTRACHAARQPRRGHLLDSLAPKLAKRIADSVVRTSYPDDATIGFFLAKFVLEGTEPAPPSGDLQIKLDALARARSKLSKHAAPAPEAAAMAAAALPTREVPVWRAERDERLKQQKLKRQRQG